MPDIDYERDLNSEQLAAVMAGDGPLLVLAAAGTGKTRTLVYRVARLVSQGVEPGRILLLTFTNRAAGQMLQRAQSLVGREVSDLWGGTFHHMANRVLRRHAGLIGFSRDYTILDRDDSRQMLRNCIEDLHLQGTEFPKPDVLLAVAGAVANSGVTLEDAIQDWFMDHPVQPADVKRVLEEYQARKLKLAAMDFDDLLANGLKLFREQPSVLAQYREKFLHVLVDEYQDTNVSQAELVDGISGRQGNIFVVGDDFQCIYSWRGASFENIMSFPDRYPGTLTFKLETNYRSVPEILAVANACIAGNQHQFQKTLRPTRPAHRRPVLARLRDGDQQAFYVVEQLQRLRNEGYRGADMAVLYRAHYHAMELQLLLTRARIPYVITSGARFFEQAHIKDVCSLLRVIHNPNDEVSFARLMGLLPRVGQRTARKIWEKLGGKFAAGDENDRNMLRKLLPARSLDTWASIERVVAGSETHAAMENAGEVIRRFVEAFYETHAVNTFEDGRRRLDDIAELILYAARFDSREQFLSEMALMTNLDAETADTGPEAGDAIRLSTVHQAKGLEWRAVVILWATEGMFPLARSLSESGQGEAEERRLFYVAVTRARDELIICSPETRRAGNGGVIYCRPSRFVEEIESGLLREVRTARF